MRSRRVLQRKVNPQYYRRAVLFLGARLFFNLFPVRCRCMVSVNLADQLIEQANYAQSI